MYLCKYTKSNNTLRVVTKEGEVIYFRFTDQGLEDNNGNVLLSPERYAAIIQQQQIEKQRVSDEKNNSERETQTISTFSLSPVTYNAGADITPNQLVLTDVSLKLPNEVILFSQIRYDGPGEVRIFAGSYAFNVIYWPKNSERHFGQDLGVYFARESEVDIKNIHTAVANAYNTWKAKFPDAVAH